MELFETLKKKQRFTEWNSSRENRFFLDNVGMLQKVPMFSHFVKAEEPFDIIRANIIIRAIKNKERMEKAYLSLAKPLRKAETLKEGDLSMEKLEEIIVMLLIPMEVTMILLKVFLKKLRTLLEEYILLHLHRYFSRVKLRIL